MGIEPILYGATRIDRSQPSADPHSYRDSHLANDHGQTRPCYEKRYEFGQGEKPSQKKVIFLAEKLEPLRTVNNYCHE
jgi:hypothetical protein